MKILIIKYLAHIILPSLLLSTLQSCSKESTTPEKGEMVVDVNGSWELTSTIISNTCGLQNGETQAEIIYLTHKNNEITITNFDGLWGNGEVNGNSLNFTGTEASDDFGTTATLETQGNGQIKETEITGSFTTTVSFNPDSTQMSDCTISSSFVMKKMEESPCLDRANFGNPDSSDYILPFPVGASYPIYQSYCWPTGGHRNQLAYDFAMSIGDTVIACRSGIIVEFREDSPDDGQGVGKHNFVHIEHFDGTLAFYAHLMQYSVAVNIGDTVEIGQYFALSGNSGYSGEPHLHIGVYEDYPPIESMDLAINFRNAQGPLDARKGLI